MERREEDDSGAKMVAVAAEDTSFWSEKDGEEEIMLLVMRLMDDIEFQKNLNGKRSIQNMGTVMKLSIQDGKTGLNLNYRKGHNDRSIGRGLVMRICKNGSLLVTICYVKRGKQLFLRAGNKSDGEKGKAKNEVKVDWCFSLFFNTAVFSYSPPTMNSKTEKIRYSNNSCHKERSTPFNTTSERSMLSATNSLTSSVNIWRKFRLCRF
jgi:hypothetical protein